MKICSIEECSRRADSHGLCQTHYRRIRLGLEINAPIRAKKCDDPCSVDGCEQPINSRGLCVNHYHRLLRGADLNTPIKKWSPYPKGATCSVEGCGRRPRRNWLCDTHSKRSESGLDLTIPIREPNRRYAPGETCSVERCDRKPVGRGFCKTHYWRFHRGQDLNTPVRTPLKPLGEGRWRAPGGYVLTIVPADTPGARKKNGGCYFMLEHRYVMQRTLGRPLLPKEQVHHRDGDKTNNDPMNLELRSGPHGKGISVTDGVIASLNYLETHAALSERERSVLAGIRQKATQGALIYLVSSRVA